ncbi:PIN-like domain-containing protein [Kocuria rosea]|uniref:PIN-like domain-containing protein n=1 Tax=Kocuria rosea TaxID=1275 RepID=UPI00232C22AE|nr:PIN domain-containing protein [Kocuria rosea]
MSDLTLPQFSRSKFENEQLQTVWNVLNRSTSTGLLKELYNGLAQEDRRPQLSPDTKLAFGFDTNAIFRLGLTRQGPNAIDYLSTLHNGPVIVPSQAVQEIWNNFLVGVEPKAKGAAKKLSELESEMEVIGQELGPLGEAAKKAIQELVEFHGDWTDPSALAIFDGTLKTLLDVADVSHVPREEFYSLALVRKETKTPPGFQDQSRNFGDYFIWADFLYGLANADLSDVEAVVFVTNDQKQDWSRNKVPHPVLVSEARSISGKEFRLWTVEDFRTHAKKIVS